MKKSILILFSSVLFFAVGCNSGDGHTHNGEADHTHDQMEDGSHMHDNGDAHIHDDGQAMQMNGDAAVQSMPIPESVSNQAMAIMEDYLEIKDALVASNKEDATAAAEALQKEIAAMEGEFVKKVNGELTAIAGATTLGLQRQHFERLSGYMYMLAKQKDMGMDLYWTHCPMAFDNKGANWISASKEIRNPYFGDRMLKCGKVQEEL